MATSPLSSPVIVDGVVSAEKVSELLALQAEYPELDYKSSIDLGSTEGLVELTGHVGAMQVRGGYILGGVDNQGNLTGAMDRVDPRPFDEANLVPKLRRYLPRPLELRTNVVERDGHRIFVICVLPNPRGCAFLSADGKYEKNGQEEVVFRAGDVFWRDGTRSVRMDQEGLEQVIERRITREKEEWIEEQQEIRRRERDELESAVEARRLGEGPLGAVNFDLAGDELARAALDFIRRDDTVALQHLLNDASARARFAIEHQDIDPGLADLLDKLTCLAATFLAYEQEEWFRREIEILTQIYAMPIGEDDVRRFGHATRISSSEVAPQVWLAIIERVFAIGGLAVRRNDWSAISALTLQLPEPLADEGYDTNWLRHALTMASRAQHFERDDQKLSLLSLARNEAARLECLRPDGLGPDDEALLTSIAQFDILSNVVAIGDAKTVDGRVFYTNFARFRQDRVQKVIEKLVTDRAMREALFPLGDDDLAIALNEIGRRAQSEGWRYDGFHGWERTPVGEFIMEHLPEPEQDE